MPLSKVGVVARKDLQGAASVLADIAGWLQARGIQAMFDTDTAVLAGVPKNWPIATRDDIPRHVELLVVLGGDGTLLGMANRIARAGVNIPLLGINFGSLGFLTEVTLEEVHEALGVALDGHAEVEERMMLRGQVVRGGAVADDRLALNDIVVNRGSLSRIIDMSITIAGERVMHVRADGLIVTTPTGSTAYNLAAGGPIVHPDVDALVLTPIAPHTLTQRPIVIPGESEVRIKPLVEGANDELYATFDGQHGVPLESGDEVVVQRAAQRMKLIRASSRTYFDVLRQKLKWGQR
ncbi:MAG TPA: NAD(+)/NADH kinase [Vicinamibacterales bacterium]|nr:NAD(+)/NADH kinase [Vicinamibacterales bacterium]